MFKPSSTLSSMSRAQRGTSTFRRHNSEVLIPRPRFGKHDLPIYKSSVRSPLIELMKFKGTVQEFKEIWDTTDKKALRYLDMTKKWTEQDKRAVMALGIAIARRHPILERYEDMWPIDAYAFDRLPKKTIKNRSHFHPYNQTQSLSVKRELEHTPDDALPNHSSATPLPFPRRTSNRPATRVTMQDALNSKPVRKFLMKMSCSVERFLPVFLYYGIEDNTSLQDFLQLPPSTRNSIFARWVREGKITGFQRMILETTFDDATMMSSVQS